MTPNEQIEVITGEYNPNGAGPGAIQPIQTAAQEAVQWGVAFLQNQKVFPTEDGNGDPINQLAQSYVNKMRANIQTVFAYRAETQQKLIRLYMATLSAIGITWAQFQAYTEVEWQTALVNVSPQVMEDAANVTPQEKSEYDALP